MEYPYTISKEAYQTIIDTLYLEIDTTLNIELQLETISTRVEGSASLQVYPIPASDNITVYLFPGDRFDRMEIMDATGKIHFSTTIKSRPEKIDISGLHPGIYILKISNGDHFVSEKLIINR